MKLPLAHILLEHQYEADDVLRKLKEAKSPKDFAGLFDRLARQHSRCSSASQGGDLGSVDLRRLDADFREAAEILPINGLSTIVRTRFGYHLIWRKAES